MPAITTIKLRRGTAAQWSSANPVLAAGEMGIETDTQRSKFGNGTSTWSALSYSVGDSSGIGTIDWTSVLNKPTEFAPEAHTHLLADVTDVTATATELNYMDGVTSAVQTQLDSKSAIGHTHNLADITDYSNYIDGGSADEVYSTFAAINGGNAGSF